MRSIKKKDNGYILLLVMIIVSSIFLLVMSIIVKNRTANTVVSTVLAKHEQNLYLATAISIIRSLLSFDQISKQKNIKKSQDSKEDKGKEKINIPLLYFNFYWHDCNKWLFYKFKDEKRHLDGKISIYLMLEDGKFPLKKIYSEYEKENKKEKSEEKKNENKIDINKKDNNNKEDKEKETKKENDSSKNLFLDQLKIIFEKSEEKSSLFKGLRGIEKKFNKGSLIMQLIQEEVKKGAVKGPSVFEHMFKTLGLKKENIYGNIFIEEEMKSKENALIDLFSISNNACSLFFISPALIEFLGQKKLQLNTEIREKIIESGKKYFTEQSNNIGYNDVWNSLYTQGAQIPFLKENFEHIDPKKIYSLNIDIPQIFSALIKIELLQGVLYAFVCFEKNKRYVKNNNNEKDDKNDNREYLIKSIYVLPFE